MQMILVEEGFNVSMLFIRAHNTDQQHNQENSQKTDDRKGRWDKGKIPGETAPALNS